ncbi:hypothetical protein [Lysobacter arvi]|uniref:Lipid/polyisoprenoid-binding YceI-like domain-containing protein n=1 Tax=Lysobacter arvi TaxID=3038776 RepID=A0ABU1C9S1_9GAMM|nr:hypothetical protein [Lysobacter arvi]MDR0181939.1 hypothetical protein [Lysobacter arvi]
MRTPALIGGLLLVSSLAIASPVFAAPTVSTVGGDTRVELSPVFTGALGSLGVAAAPSYPARLRGATASFPIPTGEIDLGSLKGEIAHAGGLDLSAGALRVNLGSFVIDTTGETPVLTGLVKVNDSVVGRLPLFDLALSSAPVVKRTTRIGQLRVNDVALTLTDEAAAALNGVFGVTAFTAGIPIGTAHVSTRFYEPDR